MNNNVSRIVYLGSIPYDQTEQQILDLCNNVGPVLNLKMMFDSQTGKSKGYAFIEFKDLESSASAIRNLNGYSLGNRHLKCGYSTQNDWQSNNSNNSNNNDMNTNFNEDNNTLISNNNLIIGNNDNNKNTINSKYNNDSLFGGLPQGIDVNINMTTPAMMISSEISKLNKSKQLNLLEVLQSCDKQLVKDLLINFPQLTFVIAELLLTNGICQVDDLTKLAAKKNNSSNEKNSNEDNNQKLNPQLKQQQLDLLRQVLQLNDNEISILPNNEKMILWDLKQRAMKGEFGLL